VWRRLRELRYGGEGTWQKYKHAGFILIDAYGLDLHSGESEGFRKRYVKVLIEFIVEGVEILALHANHACLG
jgi:hypothetical protein